MLVFGSRWERQTTRWFTVTISLLYVLQVATTIAYVTDSGEAINNEVNWKAISDWILICYYFGGDALKLFGVQSIRIIYILIDNSGFPN